MHEIGKIIFNTIASAITSKVKCIRTALMNLRNTEELKYLLLCKDSRKNYEYQLLCIMTQ